MGAPKVSVGLTLLFGDTKSVGPPRRRLHRAGHGRVAGRGRQHEGRVESCVAANN